MPSPNPISYCCHVIKWLRSSSGTFTGLGGVQNGMGRVVSRIFEILRVGSGRIKCFANLTGRVGSVQEFSNFTGRGQLDPEVMKGSRVKSGHEPRGQTGHSRAIMAGEFFLLTRGSDPCLWLTYPALVTLPAVLPKGFSRTHT